MKAKTINAVICKKFDEWLASITDEPTRKLVEKNTIITGGCIASMLLKEKVNDFDVYFTDKLTAHTVAEYYIKLFNDTNGTSGKVIDGAINPLFVEKGEDGEDGREIRTESDRIRIYFRSAGVAKEKGAPANEEVEMQEEYLATEHPVLEDDKKPRYRPVFLSSNAITLSQQIQIIVRFFGEPEAIHSNYDFVHCTNYWTSKERKVVLNQKALEAILARELVYIGSKYPLASIIRTRKFIKRSWNINAGQYLKMAFQISKLDLTNINVLEDQLVGVDSAYFGILIDALKQHEETAKADGKENTISYGYLSAIVDRIF